MQITIEHKGRLVETEETMTERPIHFPPPTADAMIRAVLDGSKTQHRIPIDRSLASLAGPNVTLGWLHPGVKAGKESYGFWLDERTACISPFGGPGDLLRVRETFAIDWECGEGTRGEVPPGVYYRADGIPSHWPGVTWRPSTNMPRWACRITRVVKRVWVEEVQDITPEDAIAEGLIVYADGPLAPLYDHTRRDGLGFDCPVKCFRDLWDSIYATKNCGWDESPWIWGCEFESTDEEIREARP